MGIGLSAPLPRTMYVDIVLFVAGIPGRVLACKVGVEPSRACELPSESTPEDANLIVLRLMLFQGGLSVDHFEAYVPHFCFAFTVPGVTAAVRDPQHGRPGALMGIATSVLASDLPDIRETRLFYQACTLAVGDASECADFITANAVPESCSASDWEPEPPWSLGRVDDLAGRAADLCTFMAAGPPDQPLPARAVVGLLPTVGCLAVWCAAENAGHRFFQKCAAVADLWDAPGGPARQMTALFSSLVVLLHTWLVAPEYRERAVAVRQHLDHESILFVVCALLVRAALAPAALGHSMPMLEVLAFTVLAPAAAHVDSPVLQGWHSHLLEAAAVAARGVGAVFEPDAGAACKDVPGSGTVTGDHPGGEADAEQQPQLHSAEPRSEAAPAPASTTGWRETPAAASAARSASAAHAGKMVTVAEQDAACHALLPLRALMRAAHVLGRERSEHIRLHQLQVLAPCRE